jgi:hypothetical protein
VKDLERTISAQTVPTGIQRIFADDNTTIDIDGSDDYRVDVDVAVIDTGIDFQHPELNVMGGINCTLGNLFSAVCDAGGDDDHYHGTHVAGTIGAIDNGSGVVGVAPGARLWAVKVLNKRGSGYSSWIIAGIDWVAANAATIEVANMSLGGAGFSQAEYDAIQGAVDAGVALQWLPATRMMTPTTTAREGSTMYSRLVHWLISMDFLAAGRLIPATTMSMIHWLGSVTGVRKWISPRLVYVSYPLTHWKKVNMAPSAVPPWPVRMWPVHWLYWQVVITLVMQLMSIVYTIRSKAQAISTGQMTRVMASKSHCWM